MRRNLPPLLALRAFEAAGRHGSFSAAADELAVTQGAVSRQVRILEDYLGMPLFERQVRGVALTAAGRRYLSMASSVFDLIEAGDVRQASGQTSLYLNVLPSCATLWLSSRLVEFTRRYPRIRLHVATSQDAADFKRDRIDLALRVGRLPGHRAGPGDAPFTVEMVEDWNGIEAVPLWQETIAPVCSLRFAEQHGPFDSLEDLRRVPLIHNASRPDWWYAWLRAQSGRSRLPRGGISVGQRFLAVLAAREGQGVACVPTADIELLDWRDELVRPYPGEVPTGDAYYLLYRQDTVRKTEIEAFCGWLQSLRPARGQAAARAGRGADAGEGS